MANQYLKDLTESYSKSVEDGRNPRQSVGNALKLASLKIMANDNLESKDKT